MNGQKETRGFRPSQSDQGKKCAVSGNIEAVVAGHICLDIIPTFEARDKGLESLLSPGRLVEVGPAVTSTGGAVSNTGLALHRLGIRTKLLGKVGEDLFGTAILDIIRRHNDALGKGIVVNPGESSSYTVVISPPGMDRMFLHCPGTNDTFGLDDVDMDQLEGVHLFHFGYPPVMRRMYEDEGVELATLMERVRAHGLTTSLDMTYPDPDSEAGRVNWVAWLERVLPHVDIFLPSLDEILFMLDRHHHDTLSKTTTGELASVVDSPLMSTLASRLLTMGVAIAVLKLGSQGLYVRTSSDAPRLASMGSGVPQNRDNWLGRELFVPCFRATVVGTAGAGDSTIAGFLAGLLKGDSIETVMTSAVAVGAFNVERPDATSGVPAWDTVQARVKAGWQQAPVTLSLKGWRQDTEKGIWLGPNDKNAE
jgi:sugar/nucleoside kinase (ribokinase family)